MGITGFTLPTPFAFPIQFLQTREELLFKWPTLAKLNNKLFPNFSRPDIGEILKLDDSVALIPSFYTGPPPSAPTCSNPMLPSANILAQCIINSTDKLFFIFLKIGKSLEDICKWWLVSIVLAETMQTFPSCLNNGQYTVDFYISHPSDFRYNVINQCFWLQYHSADNLPGLCSSSNTHLICPSNTSKAYAKRHKLLLFRLFLNLTHTDTYIQGPFDFATVNGRKSWDRTCNADWDILWSNTNMFHILLPPSVVPSYSVHVDCCTHTTFHDKRYSCNVSSLPQPEENIPDTQLYPWQKVLGASAVNPFPSFFCFGPLGVWWIFSHHESPQLAMASGAFAINEILFNRSHKYFWILLINVMALIFLLST